MAARPERRAGGAVTQTHAHRAAAGKPRAELAHLLRRAGFTPTDAELDQAELLGYRATVERLLSPPPPADDEQYLVHRHLPATELPIEAAMAAPEVMWQLITSGHPLREKVALFWHGLFATAFKDGNAGVDQAAQFAMFRRHGLGSFADLLVRLSLDPAMLVWLDNQLSAADRVNENFGRELLELFSMGRGSYDEQDVHASALAFTGWSVRPGPSAFHLGARPMWFHYDAQRHHGSPQQMLGRDVANGHDVVAAIMAQPATARYIATRLYLFFSEQSPHPETVAAMADTFTLTGGDIRAVLRTLFTSRRFLDPAVRRVQVKSPVELVVGLARTAQSWSVPDHRLGELVDAAALMGQRLLTPPNVAGWASGEAWLQGANLLERINFAARLVGASALLASRAEQTGLPVLDACLSALDLDDVSEQSRDSLARAIGRLGDDGGPASGRAMTLAVAVPEFQYC
ncbi:DUF1800 domain-containing protein [Micromonospora musae]|uniref:DUF1800 domain-containing protein n=1 Tax=Micromonospora musae TaxID=1894970 RepID=A0ABX9REP0_9ACTN|nr:DUF1800 domain-containing protein [Micromonospora musae]